MGNHKDQTTYDAVIVGSGFGGSVMAYRLAKAKLDVCLLERGKLWPPGSFPRSPYALKHAIWDPKRELHGFFNLWQFKEIGAVVSAGVGGGSLIYANVFLEKDERWFVDNGPGGARAWPIDYGDLEQHYKAVKRIVNPAKYPVAYRDSTPKTVAFREAAKLAELDPRYPKLAITFSRGHEPLGVRIKEEIPNIHGVPRYTCRLVGECDAGCNYGSKNSLDFNYLTLAQHFGAEIHARNEVKSFAPPEQKGGLFRIEATDYGPLDEGGEAVTRVIFARRLILSAGSLGTSYLLFANRSAFPKISKQLGTRFSGNGDLLTFASHCTKVVNGEPVLKDVDPTYGPVITMYARVPDTADGGSGPGYYIEDGGYPAFVAWIQEFIDLPRFLWAEKGALVKAFWRVVTRNPQRDLGDELAGIAGDRELAAGTLPLLAMGHELPQGKMRLDDGGRLDVDWSFKVAKPYNDRLRAKMKLVAEKMGGTYKDDILWKLNQVITAHPLGGCPMGTSAEEGVVDPYTGQVFGYPGLHVADGSVMPGPVGANPSLTIAAVADRFADGILRLEGRA